MKLVFNRKHCESKGIKCGNVIHRDIRGNKTPHEHCVQPCLSSSCHCLLEKLTVHRAVIVILIEKTKASQRAFFLFYGAIWHLLIQNFLWLPRWEERTQRLGSIVHSWSLAPGLQVPWCRSLSAEASEVTRIPPVYRTSPWERMWMLTHARTYKHTRMEFAFDFNADFASLLWVSVKTKSTVFIGVKYNRWTETSHKQVRWG